MRAVRNRDRCSREERDRISRSSAEGERDFRYSKNVLSNHQLVLFKEESTHNLHRPSRFPDDE
jgi:hypothetical protein